MKKIIIETLIGIKMKKLLTLITIIGALNLFAQNNITNTLGTGGSFFVKDGSTTFLTLLQSNGNVGIGTTTPAQKLHLYSDATSKVVYSLFETTDGVESVTGYIGSDIRTTSLHAGIYKGFKILNIAGNFPLVLSNSANQSVIFGTNDTERMRISASGNLGIGTTTPQAKLEVAGNVIINYAEAPGFYGQSAGNNKVYVGYDGEGTGLQLHNFTSEKSLMVQDNGDLTYNGNNVGIGTTTPTSKLQVVGIPEYADNTAAKTGGLTNGAFYRTGDLLKVVHD